MNLFKRARSTTGRGAGANDASQTPGTSRTQQATTDPVGSKSAIPVQDSPNFSYSAHAHFTSPSTSAIGGKISYRGQEDFAPSHHKYSFAPQWNPGSTSALAPPPQEVPRAGIHSTYDNHADLYAHNNLDSFVFGTAAPPAMASRSTLPEPPPVVAEDPDSDEASLIPDTTPRPSVVGGEHLGNRNPHHSRLGLQNWQKSTSTSNTAPLPEGGGAELERDSASVYTFGESSASDSALLSGPTQPSKRLSSRISSHSSSTPHTSGNDITSSEDEDMDNKHPLSSDADDHPWMSRPDRQSPLFLSEDELDNYDDEADNDRDEIYDSHANRRKGSAAIPIANPAQDKYASHRIQEGSTTSLRRGSRSLDELHSFSLSKPLGPTSPSVVVHAMASSSVPQSEGEIENVRKKSLPPIAPPSTNTPGVANTGFDPSWMENWGRTGIIGFNSDDMADIVGGLNHGARPPSAGHNTARRHSTFSTTTVDIMLRNIQAWNSGSQKYQDQRKLWVFEKEAPDSLAPPRERPSISSFFSPRSNSANEANSSLIAPFLDHGYTQKEKKISKEIWRGMPLDTEEYWINGWSGRFRVSRRNTRSERESIQQRLIFSHIRNQDGVDRIASGRPVITIHKHSKVIGFSIGRNYRHRRPSGVSIGDIQTSRPPTQPERKKQPILLAPRRIQVSYTSTTTTRKLESHGFLSEDGRKNAKDLARMEKLKKEQEREEKRLQKEREKDRIKGKEREKGNVMERAAKTFSGKGKEPEKPSMDQRIDAPDASVASSMPPQRSFEIYEGSSSPPSGKASVDNSSSTSAVTTPDPEDSSNLLTEDRSIAATSDRTTIIGRDSFFRRRGSAVDNDEQDDEEDEGEDESYDSHRRQPHRSTYRETYATLPPEVFGSSHHEPISNRFFGWGKSKVSDRIGPRHYLEVSYIPPWLTQPKNSSITRKDIVEDLNMSFQDVGLLPAIGEIKTSARSKQKRDHASKKVKTPAPRENQVDIFAHIPEDTLYMLLPLWPGETEPSSAKRYPFTPPVIPVYKRLYLLVIYKALPSGSMEDKSSKKKSRNTPDVQDDRYILLNSFHISARVVSYDELQGTCIRIPDHGLAISGPLQEAYDTMPNFQQREQYIIGVCPNRDSGFEFMPEGFEKMGLSHNVPNPRLMESLTDDDTSSMDTLAVPTPIGHAVMEMAWLGGMALTSFHRDAHWRG